MNYSEEQILGREITFPEILKALKKTAYNKDIMSLNRSLHVPVVEQMV